MSQLPANGSGADMEVAVACEKGVREENQDWLTWLQTPRGELFVVADGMGGHVGGARAARMTVDGVARHVAKAPADQPPAQVLRQAIRLTNQEVHAVATSGDPKTEKMGSTVVVALVSDGTAHIGHVGDSRAYLYRQGELTRLTQDHTEVERMLAAGMLTPAEARDHPDAHVLSRAIGSRPDVEIEIAEPLALEPGDALLFCSDGLSGFVDDAEIQRVLARQSDIQRVPDDLVKTALNAGGSDNVTIQFVRFGTAAANRPHAIAPPSGSSKPSPPANAQGSEHTLTRQAAVTLVVLALGATAGGAGVLALVPDIFPAIDSVAYSPVSDECDYGRLSWTTRHADIVDIESEQLYETTDESGGFVCLPLDGAAEYLVTARRSILWWWQRTAQQTISIERVPPNAEPSGTDETVPGDSEPGDTSSSGPAPGTDDSTSDPQGEPESPSYGSSTDGGGGNTRDEADEEPVDERYDPKQGRDTGGNREDTDATG